VRDRTSTSDVWLDRTRARLAPELEVVRSLGHGSFARVLLAREPALKRLVAVKVLRAELAADEVVRARFEREAQSAAAIRHPNVTAVYRVGHADGIPYIVMEYIGGRTLTDLLEAGGPVESREARRILASVAHALTAAHRKGIVHRDVRPGNIMVEEESGRVVLMDFGIAALLETGSGAAARLTATGVRLGDPLRMSPEQIRGEPVTAQSDVYGLGVVGHEVLTGAPPAPLLGEDRDGAWAPPERFERVGDPELVERIRHCLRPVPSHRPTAAEVADALSRSPATAAQEADEETLIDIPLLHEFLREVKQRKVGRVAVAYVAIAFVFLQAVDLLTRAAPAGQPDVLYRVIVALTLAGFPVALVLSWIFDITAQGVRRAGPPAEPGGRRHGRGLVLPLAALALSILAAIGAWLLI
jgi:serine/threonine protein kinase